MIVFQFILLVDISARKQGHGAILYMVGVTKVNKSLVCMLEIYNNKMTNKLQRLN